MAVVNGNAWPRHPVQPHQYRLRLLNACDSRTLSLSAWAVDVASYPDKITSFAQLWDPAEANAVELPLYVIGTEHGLLPDGPAKILSRATPTGGSVAKFSCDIDGVSGVAYTTDTELNQGLLMQPGERYDVIIDFAGQEGKEIYIINTGKFVCLKVSDNIHEPLLILKPLSFPKKNVTAPSEPFKNFKVAPPPDDALWNTLGQIMKFDVSLPADEDVSTPVENLCFDSNPAGVPKFSDEEVAKNRQVFAKEEVTGPLIGAANDLGPLAAVLDNEYGNPEEGKGWAKPITENVPVDQVEEWEVINISGKCPTPLT